MPPSITPGAAQQSGSNDGFGGAARFSGPYAVAVDGAGNVYITDFFNATNTPHYANPNGTLGNANFGRVTDILPLTERMVRFGVRFLF